MGEEVKKKISTQPSDAVNSTWWLLLFLGKGIICSTIGKITCEKCPKSRMGEEVKKKITPTIRCCEQHLMVGAPYGWG